jgi:hypothetical protein
MVGISNNQRSIKNEFKELSLKGAIALLLNTLCLQVNAWNFKQPKKHNK